MSRAISRDSFNETKNYLGVYLQQGRVILDADWNESQDITVAGLRRMARDVLGDSTPDDAFAIEAILPPLLATGAAPGDVPPLALAKRGFPLFFFLNYPGEELESFETSAVEDFTLTSLDASPTKGRLRIVERGNPYQGSRFLRLSGHAGPVRVMRRLRPEDQAKIAAGEIATFRFRVNTASPGDIRFVVKDAEGRETKWRNRNTAFASDVWLPGFALPLDISQFRILVSHLPAAVVNKDYSAFLLAVGGVSGNTSLEWTRTGAPPGLDIKPLAGDTHIAEIFGKPSAAGTFDNVVVRVKDGAGIQKERKFSLAVLLSGDVPERDSRVNILKIAEAPGGTPADLTRIVEWGFEVFQNPSGTPLVWDFDDVRLGSGALQTLTAQTEHFVVRSSRLSSLLSVLAIDNALVETVELFRRTVELLDPLLQQREPAVPTAGRFYAGGLPCRQVRDVFFRNQQNPNDPPPTVPTAQTERDDTVYLDAWTDAVTYVEDPEIREIALGGPDTSTRTTVKHRVRVAEGGVVPRGNGVGGGRLSTEGTYTGQVNRLYRVEIDASGEAGTATFRWSDDNASTLQRVIAPLSSGSKTVTVEEGTAFHAGDSILIKTDLRSEEHRISAVAGNIIELLEPTGPNDFNAADRPRIERWNAFRVRIEVDPGDPGFSTPVDLGDGIEIRFFGGPFLSGDYWNFRTRFLAGDEPSGFSADARIERLDFARPRGTVHHFVPLAVLKRRGSDIVDILDRRRLAGVDIAGRLET